MPDSGVAAAQLDHVPSCDTPTVALVVRPARHHDFSRLLQIWRGAVEASHTFLTRADVDWYQSVVERYLPQLNDLRVAVDQEGNLVGFVAQDEGEIYMLFVAPDAQGRGVGTTLLEDVGAQFSVVRLDVNEQNPSARAFYRARGFEETGRSDLDGGRRPFPLIHLRRVTEPRPRPQP